MSDTLATIADAHEWLTEQGFTVTERTVRNHIKSGMLPAQTSRNKKVTGIRLLDLARYAKIHLAKPDVADPSDHRARLLKQQADKIELENDIKRGKYIDRAEEEQRDAAVLAGFRKHLENAAPDRLNELISDLLKGIKDEKVRASIIAMQPEWLESDMNRLADIFDTYHGA